jgi:hypothetical protein
MSNNKQRSGYCDKRKIEVLVMYMDEVVFAGLLIVLLTCGFFGLFYNMIRRDIAKKGTGAPDSKPSQS